MKRGIITNNGQGIHISDGEVWMTAWEIADLFYITVGAINSRIKAILKANILKEYEVCRCIRLENGKLPHFCGMLHCHGCNLSQSANGIQTTPFTNNREVLYEI